MGKRLWLFLAAVVMLVALGLAGCGAPALERVDVTWETDPPPKWGLYPGYRQEIPCPLGSSYHVEMFFGGKVFTSGTVRNLGHAIVFVPAAGARGIQAEMDGPNRITLTVTLPADKGEGRKQTALRVQRDGERIVFEFPK